MNESLPALFAGLSADRREQVIAQLSDDEARELQRQLHAQDPIAFVLDTFGPGYLARFGAPLVPDIWQDEFLRALVDWPRHCYALAACKGPGKSCAENWAGWWFLDTRDDANIICTSITGDNLTTGLWKEFASWYALSPRLQQRFALDSEKIVRRGSEKTWWCYARSFPKDADKTQQANTIAGLHGRHVMYIGDEAGDYPDGVVAAAEGIFANDVEAYLILAGNTTRTSGPLYRAARNVAGRYWVKRITGDPDDPARCTRISATWARDMIQEHGREHPWVKINVLGEFPNVQSDKLLGPDDIERAARRNFRLQDYQDEPVVIGIDTAGGGDDMTVLCRRQGLVAFPLRTWRLADPMALADQIAGVLVEEKPQATFIDTGGPTGIGILYRLRMLGFPAQGIDFATDPVGDDRLAPVFGNRRAEMYWKAAQWVKKLGSLPHDIELGVELCEPTYQIEAKGKQTKFWIEPKVEIKKRLSRSPDRADAFALTFAAPVAPRGLHDAQHGQRQARTEFDPFEHLRK